MTLVSTLSTRDRTEVQAQWDKLLISSLEGEIARSPRPAEAEEGDPVSKKTKQTSKQTSKKEKVLGSIHSIAK